MTETAQERPVRPAESSSPVMTWLAGILPLALLGLLIGLFLAVGPLGAFEAAFPPVEELTIERIALQSEPHQMVIQVVNGGPDPVTIAQVLVDDAYWYHSISPARTLNRLDRAEIVVPYPWVHGETHHVKLITSTGLTFEHEIAVAVETPKPDLGLFGFFALIGVYVGVLPVAIGMLWTPFLRRIGWQWMQFFLALTMGLLLFLGVDTVEGALEVAGRLPGAFQGIAIIAIGGVLAFLALESASRWLSGRYAGREDTVRLALSFSIAIGIGLHNMGEGLAIGAAYAIGEVALGSLLIIGFTLHNTTEGLAIVAPIARSRPKLLTLVWLGLIAGAPTIAGAWIGGFTYSDIWATLFLAIGAGAIFQVVYAVGKLMTADVKKEGLTVGSFAGVAAGMLIMYGTALLV